MKEALIYLSDVKARLATSPAVADITVVAEHVSEDRGYFRARLLLANGDLLDISEYFTIQAGMPTTQEYRYQWMDSLRQLIRRWDNAQHYPGLPNFPHHVHEGNERQVVPGRALSIIELMDLIEQVLGGKPVSSAKD